MVTFTEYDAFNSDDDDSDISDNFESSLYYRYGMASRFVETSPFKTQLPKWSSSNKKKKVVKSSLNDSDSKSIG